MLAHFRMSQTSQRISPLVQAEQDAIICRLLAERYRITVEEMSERRRAKMAEIESEPVAREPVAHEPVCVKANEAKKQWAFICYQDCNKEITDYNDGKCLHGFYRVVKKADCYEFTIMECDLGHHDWQKAVRDKQVWRFPLDVPMGIKGTAFENVTPDKIHAI